MLFQQTKKPLMKIMAPRIYSFSSVLPQITYKKNVYLFFNKLINSASQDPWTPNNKIYELLDDSFPKHVKKERRKLLGQTMLCTTACAVIHLHVNPLLTAIPLFFALKYTSLYLFMWMISTRFVKKIELVDKENIEIQQFFREKTEKIIINSLEINDISDCNKNIWEITFKNVEKRDKGDYYLINFQCYSSAYEAKNYFLLIEKNPEKIPVGKLKVLKTIFSEANGLTKEEVFNLVKNSKNS